MPKYFAGPGFKCLKTETPQMDGDEQMKLLNTEDKNAPAVLLWLLM